MPIVSSSPRGRRVVPLVLTALLAGGCGPMPLAPTTATGNPPSPSAARTSATSTDAETGRLRRPFRMLFVGNSLTSANDLPAMVRALSQAAGDDPPLETQMVAFGGFALEDDLARGDAPRAIARGGWDVVVLQQGPSTLPES